MVKHPSPRNCAGRVAAVAVLTVLTGTFGLAVPAEAAGSNQQQTQTQNQNQNQAKVQNECWSGVSEFDKNTDKIVDADELGVDKEKIFDVLDVDGNDQLSKPEFIGCLAIEGDKATAIPEFFANLDKNQDGALTLSEFDIEGPAEWREISILAEKPASGQQQ